MSKCLVLKLPLRSRYGIQAPPRFPCLPLCEQTLTLPLTKISPNLLSGPIVLPFQKCHINWIICTFWVWLLSLSKMLSRFIHVLVCVKSLFPCKKKKKVYSFFIVEQCSFYGCKSLTIPKSMDIWTVSNFWLLQVKLL